MPRCVLLLPPIPVDSELHAIAAERRELLSRSATFLGWQVIDVEAIVGSALTANQVGDGVFTRYPLGDAQSKVTAALQAELAR